MKIHPFAWLLLGCTLTLSACSEEKAASYSAPAAAPQAEKQSEASDSPQNDSAPSKTETTQRLLAYSYTYRVEIENERLIPLWKKHQQECLYPDCELISANGQEATDQQSASAHLKIRLVPTKLKQFESHLTGQGGIITQRYVNSEDKTETIRDVEHRLQIQSSLRDRYRVLLNQTHNMTEILSIEKELSRIQQDIEELTAKQKQVRREVAKVLIDVDYAAPVTFDQGALSPVKQALNDLGRNFAEGLASAITFIAVSLPWAVIVLPLIVLLVRFKRKFLNRKKPTESI